MIARRSAGGAMVRFLSAGAGDDTFKVLSVYGTEALGRLFVFELELASLDVNVDLGGVLQNDARIEIDRRMQTADGASAVEVETIHGLVNRIGRLDLGPDQWTRYHVTLVPHLWQASLQKRTRVFLDQT